MYYQLLFDLGLVYRINVQGLYLRVNFIFNDGSQTTIKLYTFWYLQLL